MNMNRQRNGSRGPDGEKQGAVGSLRDSSWFAYMLGVISLILSVAGTVNALRSQVNAPTTNLTKISSGTPGQN